MHIHQLDKYSGIITGGAAGGWGVDVNADYGGKYETTNTGGSQSHTHALDGSTDNGSSLPPYFALALIMRVS